MVIKSAKRLSNLSSAIFTEMMSRKNKMISEGIDVIDLGIGSPDQPPHPELIDEFKRAIDSPEVYGYPNFQGNDNLKKAIADWYYFRFGVKLNPNSGILALMGSQDGLAHLAQAYVDEGDIVLVPDPGYPIYSLSVKLAGGIPYPMPLTKDNDFLPDFSKIPDEVFNKAKIMILNYPSNPLSATASVDFFKEVVRVAEKYNIIVAHDAAYSEMVFDGVKAPSFLEVEGALNIGIEFNSLSKSFNLAGIRIGYVVGNADIIKPLTILKSYIDFGVFEATQRVATKALQRDILKPNKTYQLYEERRDVLVDGLNKIGWMVDKPKATMFLWAEIPNGWHSTDFAFSLLEQTGIVVIPGNAFGTHGEGYVRIGMVQDKERLCEVVERINRSNLLNRV